MTPAEQAWTYASVSERDALIIKCIRNNTITPADLVLCMTTNQIIPRISFADTAVVFSREVHFDELLKRLKHGWKLVKSILDRCIIIDQRTHVSNRMVHETAYRCHKYRIAVSAIPIQDSEILKCACGDLSKNWLTIFRMHRKGMRPWSWLAQAVHGAPEQIRDLAYNEAARIVPEDLFVSMQRLQWMLDDEETLNDADILKRVWNISHDKDGVPLHVFRHPLYLHTHAPPLDDEVLVKLLVSYVKGAMVEWIAGKWNVRHAEENRARERIESVRRMAIMFVDRVALRVATPDVTRFFQEVYGHGGRGAVSAAIGWSMVRRFIYGAGDAVTIPAVKEGQNASGNKGWLGYRITSRVGRLLAVNGGVWSLAYDAIRSEDIDWFVTSCTLLPSYSSNKTNDVLNRYGKRVANAVIAMCHDRCTPFTKHAMFLMAVGGYLNSAQINVGIGCNHNLKRNALFSAQFKSVAHGMAFVANTSKVHMHACSDLFHAGFVYNPTDKLFPQFDVALSSVSVLSSTARRLAVRFKKPVLSYYDAKRIKTAWLCMKRANMQEDSPGYSHFFEALPAELIVYIVSLNPYTQFYPETVLQDFEPNVRFGHHGSNLIF